MNTGTLVAGPLSKIGRTELAQIPVPQATATHRPVPHHEIVEALVETLSFRHIAVVNEEYAASNDGMKMFGVLDLETQMEGCRFSIGIRNSHDKSLRLGLTAGLRVFVCSNMAFSAAPCALAPPSPCYTSSSSRSSLAKPCRSSAASTTTLSCCWIIINLSFPLAGSRRRRRHADRTCVERGGAVRSALGSPVIGSWRERLLQPRSFERFRSRSTSGM